MPRKQKLSPEEKVNLVQRCLLKSFVVVRLENRHNLYNIDKTDGKLYNKIGGIAK